MVPGTRRPPCHCAVLEHTLGSDQGFLTASHAPRLSMRPAGTGKVHGDRHPKISDNVLIGASASILGNIRIGKGAQVDYSMLCWVFRAGLGWTTSGSGRARR